MYALCHGLQAKGINAFCLSFRHGVADFFTKKMHPILRLFVHLMAVTSIGDAGKKRGKMNAVCLGHFEVEQFEKAGKGIGLGSERPVGGAVDFFKLPVKQSGEFRGFVVGVVQNDVSGMGMRWVRCEGKSRKLNGVGRNPILQAGKPKA